MKIEAREVTLLSVFTALYVVINFLQMNSVGNPTVYGPIQLRLADSLIALSALFGWSSIGGVTLGCFLTNAYYFIGIQDAILGPIANLVAGIIIFALRRNRFLACIVGSLPVGVIVGSYLPVFFPSPEVLAFLPAVAGMILSLTVSSLITIGGFGYSLLMALSKFGVSRVFDVKTDHNRHMKRASLVNPIISSKSKPRASNTWSKVERR